MRVTARGHCAAAPDLVWAWLAEPERHVQTLPNAVVDRRVLENGDVAGTIAAMGLREAVVTRLSGEPPGEGAPGRVEARRVDGVRQGTTVFTVAPEGTGSAVEATADVALPLLAEMMARGPVEAALAEQIRNVDRLSSPSA